jgi:hypothetical protein
VLAGCEVTQDAHCQGVYLDRPEGGPLRIVPPDDLLNKSRKAEEVFYLLGICS